MFEEIGEVRWPQRTWVLAIAGAVVGWVVQALVGRWGMVFGHTEQAGAGRLAVAAFLLAGGLSFGVIWTRPHLARSLAFAGMAGLIVAAVVGVNGGGGVWDGGDLWRLPCAIVATLYWKSGAETALALSEDCLTRPTAARCACHAQVSAFRIRDGKWVKVSDWTPDFERAVPASGTCRISAAVLHALEKGDYGIRRVQRRQFFLGEKGIGADFE